ncbi:MAG: prolipoprotein diacylglyceryl transferase [Bacteroidota bacterium]
MTQLLLAIEWNPSPEIINIGPLSLRWYGLMFATGFLFGLWMVRKMFLAEGAPEEWLDKCFMYIVAGTIIGARLGHVFFYDWDYYSQHLSEIPKIWRGGLASHGGALGVMLGLWLFSKRVSKKSILWILDKVAVPTALVGAMIRLGNLMNSEIIGKPTGTDWGFIFTRVDDVARHPAQLYESIAYLLIFGLLYYIYWQTDKRNQRGYLIGLYFALTFGARMIVENFKASQGGFEEALGNSLSTGQWLSIHFVLGGLFMMWWSGRNNSAKA